MQAQMLGCGTTRLVSAHVSRPRLSRQAVRIQAAAASSGAEAGGNVIGEAITKTYGVPYLKRHLHIAMHCPCRACTRHTAECTLTFLLWLSK